VGFTAGRLAEVRVSVDDGETFVDVERLVSPRITAGNALADISSNDSAGFKEWLATLSEMRVVFAMVADESAVGQEMLWSAFLAKTALLVEVTPTGNMTEGQRITVRALVTRIGQASRGASFYDVELQVSGVVDRALPVFGFRIPPTWIGYDDPAFTAVTTPVYYAMTPQGSTTRWISGVANDPNVGLPTPLVPPEVGGAPFTQYMRLRVDDTVPFRIAQNGVRQPVLVYRNERVDFNPAPGVTVRLINGETQWRIDELSGVGADNLAFGQIVDVAWSIAAVNATPWVRNVDGAPSSTSAVYGCAQTRTIYGADSGAPAPDFFPNNNDQRGFEQVLVGKPYAWNQAFSPAELAELVAWVQGGNTIEG
jgi:hypothetical protein